MNIVAMGMSCPVGLRWPTACAAVRTGTARFEALPYTDDAGQELKGSMLERLADLPNPTARWVQLLSWALGEALEGLSPSDVARLPVVLALPPNARGQAPSPAEILATLRESCGVDFGLQPNFVAIICEGATGGHRALAWARRYVAEHGRCLVGAADSLIGARPLANLAKHRRLLTDDNSDGVIPGEAAACLLLSTRASGRSVEIRGLGFAHEPALLTNDIPLRAEGVIAAARAALLDAGRDLNDMDLRVSDAAGESYHFKEQALLLARLLRSDKQALPLLLPAESLGHTGVAAGMCGLVITAEALARGKTLGPQAITFAGNDTGERAAAVLEAVS